MVSVNMSKLTPDQKARKLLLQKLRREKARENQLGGPLAIGELRKLLYGSKPRETRVKPKKNNGLLLNSQREFASSQTSSSVKSRNITQTERITSECNNVVETMQAISLPMINEIAKNPGERGAIEIAISKIIEEAQSQQSIITSEQENKVPKRSLIEQWHLHKESVFQSLLDSMTCTNKLCDGPNCLKELGSTYVSCTEHCFANYCLQCDASFHSVKPYHKRTLVKKEDHIPLQPREIVSAATFQTETTFVPVPIKTSRNCERCAGKMNIEATPNVVAVVTRDGRFDLNEPHFRCNSCENCLEVGIQDYISSGFWTGTPKQPFSYLFCQKLLSFWHNLMFLTPGTSEQSFLESVREMAEETGRSKVIDSNQFQAASRSFRWARQSLEERIMLVNNSQCRACLGLNGDHCVKGLHADGNHKLVRRRNKREQPSKGFFEGKIITPQEDFDNFKEMIDSKRGCSSTYAGRCGSSEFQAAKEASKRFKSLDETGILMGSCAHGTILVAVNMHAGETYKHTMFVHMKASKEFKIEFFINDVVCLYWPWAVSIGKIFPQITSLTQDTKPFLSYVHGQAHDINCRVEYFGHWQDGATAIVGEEQEQVFSTFSRYYNVTHKMTKANRNDHLTAAMLYWNRRKEKRLPKLITHRLLTASFRIKFYEERLKFLLIEQKVIEEDLPRIKQEVIEEAIRFKENSRANPTEITKIQSKLETLYFKYVNCAEELKTLSVSSKMRKSFVRKRSMVKENARKLIEELNTHAEFDLIEEDYFNGDFPWDTLLNDSKFKSRYKLIDCWMFLRRNEEQILQSNKEMHQYQVSIFRDLEKLKRVKQELLSAPSAQYPAIASRLLLLSTEIRKQHNLLGETLLYNRFFDGQGVEAQTFLNNCYDSSDSDSTDEND